MTMVSPLMRGIILKEEKLRSHVAVYTLHISTFLKGLAKIKPQLQLSINIAIFKNTVRNKTCELVE